MTGSPAKLEITTAPFLHRGLSTSRLMGEVLLSLIPVILTAAYYFGVTALLLVLASSAGAVLTEWTFRGTGRGLATLMDGSALLTGSLLALTLPPATPLWMAFVGGVFGVALGKTIWGGLGQNLFNPALVGRAFLQAAFPTVITTWTAPRGGFFALAPSTLAWPLARSSTDVVTVATPLGLAKFESQTTDLAPLLLGNVAGSLGETAGLVLLVCGLWLGLRRVFDWRLPVATLLTVALASAALHALDPARYPGATFMLLSGGLLFATVFMVTDPVTTPITLRGAWLFGIGVGLLVILIRLWGGLPEGVMYAILLMNAVTPLINRVTQPRRFGG
ncbi:MAG: RnfABCDGE type electron transport complex subunit D [Acidobacteriota bacterium]|nr:RnfABCDGE type electron transport complex subunit D [Acidobacteriota bacterium]